MLKAKTGKKRSLRRSVALVILASLLLFAVVFVTIFYNAMPSMLLRSETEFLKKQVHVVDGLLKDAQIYVYRMAEDIGNWDECANFAEGKNPTFIEVKWMGTNPMRAYRCSFMAIKDINQNDVYVGSYDYINDVNVETPEGMSQSINDIAAKVISQYKPNSDYDLGWSGLYFYGDIPYILATLPVTASMDAPEPSGTVTLGLLLTQDYLRTVSHYESSVFEFVPPEKAEALSEYEITRKSHDLVTSSLPLTDQHGRPAQLLISDERIIYTSGWTALAHTSVLLVLCIALLYGVLHIFNARLVITPLERLSNDMAILKPSGKVHAVKYSNSTEFASLCESINGLLERQAEANVSVDVLTRILNGVEGLMYVSDPDTDKILFINGRMSEAFNLSEDVVGKRCWEVLQSGFTERCSFCPNYKLAKDPSAIIEWDEHNTATHRYFHNTDRLIEWPGKQLVHLQFSVDVTEAREYEAALQQRLEQQELMSALSQNFVSPGDLDTLICNALGMTGSFLKVSKIVMAKVNAEKSTVGYAYGWVNSDYPDISITETSNAFVPGTPIYDAFVTRKEAQIVCSDTSQNPDLKYLHDFGVVSALMLPIIVEGELWGIITIDECNAFRQWSESDMLLLRLICSVISGALARGLMDERLVAAKLQAEESSRAKGDFLSRMSHEMRTPMGAIIGMTTIARMSDNIEKKEYCLNRIEEASKHLLGVINDILDMSKIEANKLELSYTEFNLERMLMRVVDVANFRIAEKKQNLIVRIDPTLPSAINSDEQRMAQVITNFMSNAAKFTPDRGDITLAARCASTDGDSCTLEITVTDTGIGITEEQRSRLFHPFEQADGGISRRYGGTGLGLAISKRIIDLMGGEVWADSTPGEGSTFGLRVNVKRGQPSRVRTDVSWDKLRVLAVDDSPEVLEYFGHFARASGFACDLAESGAEALRLLENEGENPYNLAFIDWRMEGMNGVELTRRIKQRSGSNLVVVMISAAEWSDIEAEAKQAGVDRFLPKPLFSSVIVDIIYECMGSDSCADDSVETTKAHVYTGKRILLAEDVDINREIVLTMMMDTEAEIDSAVNGAEACRIFAENPDRYDIIFMDIHMPEMDGYEATRRIRAMEHPMAKTVPIIAMTANVFREDVERCLAAGMNDHVGKPINFDELFDKLDIYLGSASR